ncbi:MAG: LPS-assembly protein LptD [Rhodobacteraceae bacterium]|nr:LPS-assembly protein LptD [Paracoccaceae bacterium]
MTAPAPIARLRVAALALGVWLACALAPHTASAQASGAMLMADSITASQAPERLVASGNVEIVQPGARLSASRIVYDRATGRIDVEGPLVLTTSEGVVFLADQAELSDDMRAGLLRGARLVLEERLQIAAAEIRRVDADLSRLDRVVATSCRICAASPVPAWSLRARQVVHDAERQRLYFTDAQLRLWDVPVAWVPRLRVPDPSATRATGFLVPSLISSSRTGTGVRAPIFFTLGDHADITLSPYLTTGGTRTLEFRFRRAFANGRLEVSGAGTRDALWPGPRGHVSADGEWKLRSGARLELALRGVSDRAYLAEYGYPGGDRLQSRLGLSRVSGRRLFEAQVLALHSLRDGESNQTIPWLQAEVVERRRFAPPVLGGTAGVTLGLDGYYRNSSADVVGRDGLRLMAGMDWRREALGPGGLVLGAQALTLGEIISIADDAAFPDPVARATSTLAIEARLPLVRHGPRGGQALVTPRAQVVWTPGAPSPLPNEDSVLVEFDEANLFALSRFPGLDRKERGLRINLGGTASGVTPGGWGWDAALGRVYRLSDPGQFTPASGLSGRASHVVAAFGLRAPQGFSAVGRAVAGPGAGAAGGLSSAEARVGYEAPRLAVAAGYTWLRADAAEGRPTNTAGLALDGHYMFADGWAARGLLRHDIVAGSPIRAGLGLEYRTDCIVVDLSLSRRFASSANVPPQTNVGLTLSLAGLGDGRAPRGGTGRCG